MPLILQLRADSELEEANMIISYDALGGFVGVLCCLFLFVLVAMRVRSGIFSRCQEEVRIRAKTHHESSRPFLVAIAMIF